MATFIALLRAVNVGGTGKLPMAELRTLCAEAGFHGVRTYIQSGNVVLGSDGTAAEVKAALEAVLAREMGKPCQVLVRTPAQMEAVRAGNPFPESPPNRLLVLFMDEEQPDTALDGWNAPGGERLALRGRELYVHFPEGQGHSRLKVPFRDIGTGRNLNTVRKLIAIAGESGGDCRKGPR